MRRITQIIIHCSATPNGVFIAPRQVDEWHAARGFKRDPKAVAMFNVELPHIGYHGLINTDGRLYAGRHTDEIGAHAAGHNANSVGLCMIGTDKFYLSQWEQLEITIGSLAAVWEEHLLLPNQRANRVLKGETLIVHLKKMGITIIGHRDLSPDKNGDGKITSIDWLKTCPGFDVTAWIDRGMWPDDVNVLDDVAAIKDPSATIRAITGRVAI